MLADGIGGGGGGWCQFKIKGLLIQIERSWDGGGGGG